MAGFGGDGGSSKGGKNNKDKKKKNAPPVTLKPKQQWDRYAKQLKSATAFKVGVRVVNDKDGNENENVWLETGKVKSENDESTEIAAAVQRGIIAEVLVLVLVLV